jgi:hypothetical protein
MLDLPTAGSWPDWFAAFGTVGTLGFVVVGLLRDRTKQREQDLQQWLDRRDNEALQARLVTSHMEWRYISSDARSEGFWYVEVQVDNDSDGPILDLRVEPVPVVPEQIELFNEQDFPAGGYGPIAFLEASERRVLPGQPVTAQIFVARAPKMPARSDDSAARSATFEVFQELLTKRYEIKVAFTDLAGRRWARLGSLQPVRVRTPLS